MPFTSPFPDIAVPDISLSELVLARCSERGDRPALVCGASGRTLSFAELADGTRAVAAGLARRGVRKGDVVGLWAPNMPEYPVVFHAVARLGAVLTTANPAYTADELAFQLRDADARMVITMPALEDRARTAVAQADRAIQIVIIDPTATHPLAPLAADGEPPAVVIDPATDVVAMPYSSGTTGLPKGVMLTHRNLVANLLQIDAMESRRLEALVGVLPFFHIYGMVVIMNFALMRGATLVTLPRFELEAFLQTLQKWPIALAHVVPPVVVALAKHPAVDGFDLSGLKCLFSGAAPLGADLTVAVEARLGIRINQGYGMTEASPVTHYTPAGWERAGKVGQLAPSTECRIVHPGTGADLGAGNPGEVWIRGPQVMKGYLNNPEATATTLDADGWLHTGDIGFVDAEGYLEIVDRLKELIKVKGYQVPPAELEALLLKHPAIADAAVIPVRDDESGEVPKAFIVARGPLTPDEVMAFVETQVAHYKRLRYVAFVESIPKSASGKILRRVLIERERLPN